MLMMTLQFTFMMFKSFTPWRRIILQGSIVVQVRSQTPSFAKQGALRLWQEVGVNYIITAVGSWHLAKNVGIALLNSQKRALYRTTYTKTGRSTLGRVHEWGDSTTLAMLVSRTRHAVLLFATASTSSTARTTRLQGRLEVMQIVQLSG